MLESVVKLIQDPRSIFSINELSLILQEQNCDRLSNRILYYVNHGLLFRITRGLYSKTKDYDPRELAAALYQPSYLTFETVLIQANILPP